MDIALSLVAIALAALALWKTRKENGTRRKKTASRVIGTPNEADRTDRAVQQREHLNFMNYDGSAQLPVDRESILAQSGE